MKNALIGSTGFVGSNIMGGDDGRFSHTYHSSNINEIDGQEFDLVVSAGFSAVKWKANQDGDEDWKGIRSLLDHLENIRTKQFVLISTVDVYPTPSGVDEDTAIEEQSGEPYGRNRLLAEMRIREMFPKTLVIRLPALFGKGLKKNVIFDLLNANELASINPRSSFQYYDLSRIWEDMHTCLSADVPLVNFVTPPIATDEIIQPFFPGLADRIGTHANPESQYDIRTKHAALFGNSAPYLYGKEESLERLGAFIRSASSYTSK